MFADDAPPLEWEVADGGARRYTRAAVELYYLSGAGGRPLAALAAGAGGPGAGAGAVDREAREDALARALHGGWPAEEEDEEEGEGEKEAEEHEADGDDDDIAALAAGGRRRRRRRRPGSEAPRLFVRLDAERLTLGAALRLPGHVVAGVPVFWVVARGTEYHARWLREAPMAAV
jgi:hypothetical protein